MSDIVTYLVLERGQIVTTDYRHRWMDSDKKELRKRWDNTPDHPELDNFPHHIHIGDEASVVPSHPMSLNELLRILESELSQP